MDFLDRCRLDVPVVQAGMGPIAGARLAGAVAAAGGLGTIGVVSPERLRVAIRSVREFAPGRSVAVNLLARFTRRKHVEICVAERVDVVVVAFGGDAGLIARLREAGSLVLMTVGTEEQARTAVAWGADGLVAQGREAGGHLVGTVAALEFLPRACSIAAGRPVLLAGGVATGADTAAALAAGATGVVAGTRFVLAEESEAHPEYRRRVLTANRTLETTLFGLGWPARHRVVPNAATLRWSRGDGSARWLPSLINVLSGPFSGVAPASSGEALLRRQRAGLPVFGPLAPLTGMPDECAERAALYAGESALRMTGVVSAKQAVAELAGRQV